MATVRSWALGDSVSALLPDRRAVVAITSGPRAELWRLDPGQREAPHRRLGLIPAAARLDPASGVLYLAGTTADGQGLLEARDRVSGALRWQHALNAPATAIALAPGNLLLAATTSGRIEMFSLAGARSAGTLQLDAAARELLALPYGHEAFALTDARLALLDTARSGILAYLPVGDHPQHMILKPDGGELYVSDAGGTVTVLDTSTGVVSATLAAGLGADAMAVTPDGSLLLVANAASGTLSATNLATRKPAAFLRLGMQPRALALAPGGYLFAADSGSNDLAVVRLGSDANHPYALMTLLPTVPAPARLAVLPEVRP